jgi:hypothetical protein
MRYSVRGSRRFALVAIGLLIGTAARAEWAEQTITLNPGWNAVYLTVQPEPGQCEAVFSGVPVDSVWTWNKRFTPQQFVRDPENLTPEEEDWLTWFPESSYNAFLTSFYGLTGGKAYLIDYAGDSTRTLRLKGQAVIGGHEWLSDSFNLAGFDVDPENAPSFEKFFGPAPELRKKDMYRLGTDGRWRAVTNLGGELLRAGEAYLIYSTGPSTYTGPLAVKSQIPGGLKFGLEMHEQQLVFQNETDEEKLLTLSLAPSARQPGEGDTPVAGDVALYYKQYLAWHKVEDEVQVSVKPKSEGSMQLGVRRAEMGTPATPGASFENTLRVSDGQGSLVTLPVSALVAEDDAGLYVGLVSITAVSEATANDRVTPKPASSEFRFRLIVHRDDRDPSNVTLLQHVTVMQVQPQEAPDPDNPGGTLIVPARYVLLADDTLIPNYEGVSMLNGEIVGRRISTPVFSFDAPVALVQDTGNPNVFRSTVTVAYDDPLNPFYHRYHPDHNNLNELYQPFLDGGGNDVSENVESYTFQREITLTFQDEDPAQLGDLSWGYDLVGGTYQERIIGVHREDLYVSGTFRLNRISEVPRLDDAL